MKNSVELRQDRAALIAEANVMLESCKTESRDFNETEQVSYDEKMTAIDKLAKNIETVERQEKLNAEIASNVGSASVQKTSDIKEVRDYSVFKAIKGMMDNNLDGVEKEMHQQAVNEARAAGHTVNGLGIPASMLESRAAEGVTETGSAIAPTSVSSYVDAMRESSVFGKVGATILNGLSANTIIPITGTSTVNWETEVATTTEGGQGFGKVTLSPNRLSSFVDISKQLLLQSGSGAEAAIMKDLGRAVAQKIDTAIFTTAGVTGAPDSIGEAANINEFIEATYNAGTSVVADMVTAQGVLAQAGGLDGNLAYVASPHLMGQIKTGAQVDNVLAALQGNSVAGYPCYFTNGCTGVANTSGDFYFGDFSKLFIGLFGGLDIVIDPYTQAASGSTRIVLNNYLDWGVAQERVDGADVVGKAFVKATSALV